MGISRFHSLRDSAAQESRSGHRRRTLQKTQKRNLHQITYPGRIRKKFKIEEGAKLEVVETSEGILFKLKESTRNFTDTYPQFATSQEMKKLLIKLREKDAKQHISSH